MHNGKSQRLRNWKMTLMYDGSRYAGWQRQGGMEKRPSIQGIIEAALSGILGESIGITGAGRTDAGVHALGQTANFHTRNHMDGQQLKKELNQSLPEDIKVKEIELAPNDFHSRYGALKKIYEYHLEAGERPWVFRRKYAAHIENMPDVEKMQKAASCFLGRHDFKGFSSSMSDGRGTSRTIYDIQIIRDGKQHLIIRFIGDGFLYHMVRLLAGTLVEVGLGRKTLKDVEEILKKGDRQRAGPLMPGKGLFLVSIIYKNNKKAIHCR